MSSSTLPRLDIDRRFGGAYCFHNQGADRIRVDRLELNHGTNISLKFAQYSKPLKSFIQILNKLE